MKFCKRCGCRIDENAIFCPTCGAQVNGDTPRYGNTFDPYGGGVYNPVYDTAPSKFIAVISFLFWQVGLIIWFFCRQTRPGKARSASKGALGGVCFGMPILGAVLWVLWKDDQSKRDYAKVCGISALVGAGIYALAIALSVVLSLAGVEIDSYSLLPLSEFMAYIF